MALADPPEDLATPTLKQFVDLTIENRLEDLHTFSWGSVLSYNSANQTCSVQIIPRRHFVDINGTAQSERPAPLLNVPVKFPGSGAFSMTWPVKLGDVVLLAFTETALDAFLAGGQSDVDAGDARKHHITDAVAIPGLRPLTAPISSSGIDGSAMVIAGPALKLGASSAVDAVIKGDAFLTALSTLNSALNTLLSALTAFANTCTTSPPSTPAATLVTAIGVLQTAIGTFTTAATASKSTLVKVGG